MKEKLQEIRSEKGFTLAELLVVILIIAILATLAIVFFGGQQGNAEEGVAKANIRSAYSSAQAAYAAEGGAYPALATLVSDMDADGVDASELASAAAAAPATGVGVFVSGGELTLKSAANGTTTCTGTSTDGSAVSITCS